MNTVAGPARVALEEVEALLGQVLGAAETARRQDVGERLVAARAALGAESGRDSRGGIADPTSDPTPAAVAALDGSERALATLECDLRARRAVIADPVRSARLCAELSYARTRSERFATAGKEWQHMVSEGFAALNSDTDFALRRRARALLAEGETAINGGRPALIPDADAALRGRLLDEADQAYQRLFDGVRGVTDRVATLLELPAVQRPSALPVLPPRQLVAALPAARRPRPGAPLPVRVLKVFRPGWSGILMILIATRLLGVALPGWVIAGCAVAGAVALGGAAYTGERKRQLDRDRMDATAALRGTVEDFQLALGKQLRDASRALQQDFRRRTSALVTGHIAALTEELAAVRVEAEADRQAPARLAEIARDLAGLDELRARTSTLRRQLVQEPVSAAAPAFESRRLHVVA